MTYSNIANAVNTAQQAAQLNTNAKVKNLESLSALSTKAGEILDKYKETVAKNDEAEGYNDFIENGLSEDEVNTYNENKDDLNAESDKILAISGQLQEQGADYSLIDSLHKKSRAYQIGAAKALTQRAGEAYPINLQSFLSDTKTQHTSPTGETFIINTATPAQYRYALSLNRKQFLMDSGLIYINKGLVNDLGVRKVLTDSDNKAIINQNKTYNLNASQIRDQEIISEFNATGDYFRTFAQILQNNIHHLQVNDSQLVQLHQHSTDMHLV